jgi:hypothetical protein
MTNRDFVIWFKGFMDGAHHHNITPAQWDMLKEKIKEVNDDVAYYDYEEPNESLLAAAEKYKEWVSTNTYSVSSEPKKELLND